MLIGVDASRSVTGRRTGTEGYSHNLLTEMLRIDGRNRYRLYFNTAPCDADLPLYSRAEVARIPFPRLWTHLRLSAEIASHPPDLLFVPAHVLPVVHPRRSVVTVHDLGYLAWPGAHPFRRWLYLHLSTRYSAIAATLVITDSEATRRDLVRRYGVPAERVRVVHLGHGPEFAPRSEAEIAAVRSRYALDRPYVLFVGTVQPRKNLARLIRAFLTAQSETGVNATLVLAGRPGWGSSDVVDLAGRNRDRVRLLDYVPHADLPPLLSGAVALAFPSLYEGFGLPALEAMACGTPVVTSNTSSLPEVVGDAGLLATPTDVDAIARSLARILSDENLRQDLRERGLRRAAHFTWTRCAEQTIAVLEEAGG